MKYIKVIAERSDSVFITETHCQNVEQAGYEVTRLLKDTENVVSVRAVVMT